MPDLEKRVEQLEKEVAELKKAVQPAGFPPVDAEKHGWPQHGTGAPYGDSNGGLGIGPIVQGGSECQGKR